MKKFWAAVAIIAVVAGLFFLFRSKNPPTENSPSQNGADATNEFQFSGCAKARFSNVSPGSIHRSDGTSAAGNNDLAARAASPNSAAATLATPTNRHSCHRL